MKIFHTFSLFLVTMCSCFSSEKTITTEFVTLSLNRGTPAYYYKNKGNIVKLEVSAQGIGAPVAYGGAAVLALYDNPADLSSPDLNMPKPQPALEVALPRDQDRILLVFSKSNSENKNISELRALGIATDQLKLGDYRIYNLAQNSVYVIMNDQKAVVQSGKTVDISAASLKSETLDMGIRLGLKEGEGLREVYSSVWGHRPTRRSFLFVFDRKDRFNPFEIRLYHDVPQTRTNERGE